ncbi:bifunctional tRNA (5-methylaminomethyl-2-thiouridine)(34)-methyltransferase MnmD/FAD-dependent 5-carboxymethylaminomethyl-2-thiouridine(34) oxidoreductase MnmC [Campylobacter sp. MG1]|uniref:bifunctional tRNA (5-methylaminomethyl-2-thiouridine)(34)-methyltransferase MnmD/FAD-dependent 5-carboxymethylaminomethyl-2-thiouridine(34) oxidoreductase MnmC n=1 Tax=Campylobacter sp. MG1 TaxID=2976332 RepID=UPI00226C74B7|nr:bifunctional tRNA (5-methylaminomethyl-2-thiouridine)(34)-methyltransferase MnmD/FAD-dependent 5-carboxymethylaminomethyl-2-thiouridine(34) oxidoreductase MnmC [Campylobacter sp. MG1]
MNKANWILKDNEIFSLDFNDFYYNTKEPLKERYGVYVNNAFSNIKDTLTILEFGFGLGLNFLLSAKLAKEKGIKLYYVSIENYYHNIKDLIFFAKKFNLNFDDDFIKYYPPCKNGIYRISYENITIDLVFLDINDALDNLDLKADIIYADGFSPKKNNDMFSYVNLEKLTKLLKPNAKLLSYSSNSNFKNALKTLGFSIENINLGIKRESTLAIYNDTKITAQQDGYFAKTPLKAKKIAIVGGGVASACLAYELSKFDYEISVFERHNTLANEGSGNKIGLLTMLIQNPQSLLGQFSEFSFWHSSNLYKNLGIELNGVLEHAFNDELKRRFVMQKDNPFLKFYNDFAFLKDGGALEPYKLVPYIFSLSKAKVYLNHELLSFNENENSVILNFNDKSQEFDIVIFATGVNNFFKHLTLSSQRGQVTWLKSDYKLKHSVSSKAYLTIAKNGVMVLGATYDRNLIAPAHPSYDLININNYKSVFSKDLSHLIIGNRVGYRCYSSDRFPIVGAIRTDDYYINTYKNLQFTKTKPQEIPEKSRIFISTAHGSRGLATSLTSARLIVSNIKGIPSGMLKSYEQALHPARFIIRKLKKGLS